MSYFYFIRQIDDEMFRAYKYDRETLEDITNKLKVNRKDNTYSLYNTIKHIESDFSRRRLDYHKTIVIYPNEYNTFPEEIKCMLNGRIVNGYLVYERIKLLNLKEYYQVRDLKGRYMIGYIKSKLDNDESVELEVVDLLSFIGEGYEINEQEARLKIASGTSVVHDIVEEYSSGDIDDKKYAVYINGGESNIWEDDLVKYFKVIGMEEELSGD